jgi:pimeloyl-ACP methyl ester carboxylesterase
MVRGALEHCKQWPKARLPKNLYKDWNSPIPALITSGEFDPVTPPRWGEVARAHFPNSLHIVAAKGHHFDEHGCLAAIASEFLSKAAVRGLNLNCALSPEERLKVVH